MSSNKEERNNRIDNYENEYNNKNGNNDNNNNNNNNNINSINNNNNDNNNNNNINNISNATNPKWNPVGINGSSSSITQTLGPSDSRPLVKRPDLWDILIDAVVTICISRKRSCTLSLFYILQYLLTLLSFFPF